MEPKEEINPRLEKALNNIAKGEGFVNYEMHAKKLIPDGQNYLGVLTEVTIKGTTKDGNKELDLFVKSIIPGKNNIEMVNLDDLYGMEIYVYTELSRILTELQDEAKIPPRERYNFVKCYEESNIEFIIMENVAKKGYAICERFNIATLDFAKKCIENLAKFHALSFVLQAKMPKYFKDKIEKLEHPFRIDEKCETFLTNNYNACLDYLDDSAKIRFKNFLGGASDLLERFKNYTFEPNSTLCFCHGDYKSSNVMKRECNGEVEVLPVDFQLLHYGAPIYDVLFFIFTTTDRKFRQKNLDYLKNLYYNTMEKFMKYFDLHVEDFFSKAEYEREWKNKLDYGLLIGIWVLPLILADDDKIPDLGKTELTQLNFGKNDRAKTRIIGLVEDFIEWGYL